MPRININQTTINYEISGSGKAIVFLHGFTGSLHDWDNQRPLITTNHTFLGVDHRGHGGSDAPAAESQYSIQTFSDDVYSLLRALEIDQCCLVGHSMGGFMSLQLALDHPEMVAGLVLVDTSSGEFESMPGYEEHRAKLDDLARNQGLEAAFEYDAANNQARVEKFEKHPELREIAKQKVLSTSVDGYIFIARTFSRWNPVTNRLNQIKAPTLIYLGEEDAGFIKASQILNEGIKGSKLITIPGAGHSPHEETPELFNQPFLEFLDGLS